MKKLSALVLTLLLLLTPTLLMAATVTDAYGNIITIDAAPERIVTLPVWAEEMLLDMVDVSRIAGVSVWGDDPVISATADKAADVAARVSSSDLEGILSLAPDLVIIDTFTDYDGSITKTLNDAGIAVLAIASPTDFDSIRAALGTIGEAVFATEDAQLLVDQMDETLAAIAQTLEGLSEDERVTAMFYEDYYDPSGASAGMLCAYGEDSTFNALCDAAFVVNVCDAPLYSAVSKEKIVGEWKPSMLIVPGISYDADFSTIDDGGETARAGILADETLAALPAVADENIIALSECFRSSTSHYMADGAYELAEAAYPSLFE